MSADISTAMFWVAKAHLFALRRLKRSSLLLNTAGGFYHFRLLTTYKDFMLLWDKETKPAEGRGISATPIIISIEEKTCGKELKKL